MIVNGDDLEGSAALATISEFNENVRKTTEKAGVPAEIGTEYVRLVSAQLTWSVATHSCSWHESSI
jgi:hypothetical protein